MQNQTNPKPSGAPMAKLVLIAAMIISLGVLFGAIGYLTKNKPAKIQQPQVLLAPEPSMSVEDETADWKIYRNEEYGFEIKYPSYTTITNEDKNISLNLNFGSELKDAANSWSVSIAEIKNYGVYSYDDGYIVYDIINNKWYTTNQFTLGKFDANEAEKIEEYSPETVAKTYDGSPVFGKDFYYYDVGNGSLWYPIIYKDKNLIIEFSRSIDENGKDQIIEGLLSSFNSEQNLEMERSREKLNKKMEETQNKIDKDFMKILSTFKFIEK